MQKVYFSCYQFYLLNYIGLEGYNMKNKIYKAMLFACFTGISCTSDQLQDYDAERLSRAKVVTKECEKDWPSW